MNVVAGAAMINDDDKSSVSTPLQCGGARCDYDCCDTDEIKVRRTTQSETRRVRTCRAFIVSLMLGAGALTASVTYRYLDNHVTKETENEYHRFVNKIEEVATSHVLKLLNAVESLSMIITAQAKAKDRSFPFVTVENFEAYCDQARKEGEFLALSFLPWLKTQKQIESFPSYAIQYYESAQKLSIEQYTKLNSHARNTSYSIAPMHPFVYNSASLDQDRSEGIPSMGPDPVIPAWMQSPPLQQTGSRAMRNEYMFFKPLLDAVMKTKAMLLGPNSIENAITVDLFVGEQAHNDYHAGVHGNKAIGIKTSQHPHGIFIAPVFTNLDATKDEIGAFLIGFFGFDTFLVNILPNGIRGINLVIKNSCNGTYTFDLNGNETTYIGEGNLSALEYSYLAREIYFDQYLYANSSLQQSQCSFMFYVTPTSLYMQDNESKIPIMATLGIVFIFAFMVFAFIIYDINVQKRKNKISHAAARSHAVVSSIFPSSVRERLFKSTQNVRSELEHEADMPLLQSTKTSLKTYLADTTSISDNHGGDLLLASKPLADLFPDTTIMFADICGFKEWSYARDPSHVFTLLETLFRAFDLTAKKRSVFKVETVANCYVAVCGLPDPRKDHAVIMARFATDCMNQMAELLIKLETELGPGTSDLCMRVGLHSGPVIAGVLRSTRSTFQLFGDTMNTASRMQSTGEGNRIQVSDDTAKHLSSAGKQHWLTPREQQVFAKGKGMMSTYWLTKRPKSDQSSN